MWTLLLNNKLASIFAAVAGVFLIASAGFWTENRSLDKKIEAQQANIAFLTAANTQCTSTLDRQNDAISQLQRLADEHAATARIVIQAAAKKAENHTRSAQEIQIMPVAGNECETTKKLLSAYVGRVKP